MNGKDNSHQSEYHKKWKFCPHCGTKIPEIEKSISFCFSCGLEFAKFPYIIEKVFLEPEKIQLKEDELDRDRKAAPWSTRAAIVWPILSIFIMNSVAIIPFIFIAFFITDPMKLMEFILSPLFLIIFSASEFVFLIVPIIYVGQYLRNPSLKNRFKVLGIYSERPNNTFITKEIFLGIGFAILGFFLVNLISILLEFTVNVFGTLSNPACIFYNSFPAQTPSMDMESIISSANPLEIVLLVIVMIVIIGLSEEVAFRGFMQKGLVKNYGKELGIWITAIIFSLIHVVTIFLTLDPLSILATFFILFPPYLVLSLLLGYLFYWRNSNLIAPIIAHGVYNAITVLLVFILYQQPDFLIPFLLILAGILALTLSSFYAINRYWQ